MDDKFNRRIQSGLETARRWDSDASLLAECRSQIPFEILCPEQYYLSHQVIVRDCDDKKMNNASNPYSKPEKENQYEESSEVLLLQRLAVFFQKSMTWVNNPPCVICGFKDTFMKTCTGPLTQEEREGDASRVERYFCPRCNKITTAFPRFNNPRTLLQTRRGRCGEYANLMGLFTRSIGFETRYILDLTDHVWIEVFSPSTNRWIMIDGCEGTIDEPSMYEHGWGKKLNYILAFSTEDGVVDVTRRYTRNFATVDFMERRRAICPAGEIVSDMAILQASQQVRSNLKPNRIQQLESRDRLEQAFFRATESLSSWDTNNAYAEGRISGSLAWRVSRGESGENSQEGNTTTSDNGGNDEAKPKNTNNDDATIISNDKNYSNSMFYHIESIHPSPHATNKQCSIVLQSTPPPPSNVTPSTLSSFPECISVSSIPCGVGLPNTISIVIVDECQFCILQSRTFQNWVQASHFLNTVLDDRIVVIHASMDVDLGLCDGKDDQGDIQQIFVKNTYGRVGGLDLTPYHKSNRTIQTNGTSMDDNKHDVPNTKLGVESQRYLHYAGQMNHLPPWTTCLYNKASTSITVTIDIPENDHDTFTTQPSSSPFSSVMLHCEWNTIPKSISCRLPDNIMSLESQCNATEEEKQVAALEFLKNGNNDNGNYLGYCTKENAPVYLLKKEAFPFRKYELDKSNSSSSSSSWKTFHFLPKQMVLQSQNNDPNERGNENTYNPYLARDPSCYTKKEEKINKHISTRIKELFAKLMTDDNMDANTAAARAIRQIAEEDKEKQRKVEDISLGPGTVKGKVSTTTVTSTASNNRNSSTASNENSNAITVSKHVAQIAKKYVQNVRKNPSAYRFRTIKLTNKVFDKISASTDGLEQILKLGFVLYADDTDFVATIPLGIDLERMMESIDIILKEG